jgi:hypothetical protein
MLPLEILLNKRKMKVYRLQEAVSEKVLSFRNNFRSKISKRQI